MTTYRTGGHWGRTIVRVGQQPDDSDGRRPDDFLICTVDSAVSELAERICELLNAMPRAAEASGKPVPCTRCGGPIQHVDAPPVPEGWRGGTWEGWFHLDRSQEHFTPVGWVR